MAAYMRIVRDKINTGDRQPAHDGYNDRSTTYRPNSRTRPGHLELIEGENPSREGPGRYPPALRQGAMDAYLGLQGPAEAVIGRALFEHEGSQMVVVKDIEFSTPVRAPHPAASEPCR